MSGPGDESVHSGSPVMTKRELMEMLLMAALTMREDLHECGYADLANDAIDRADALISAEERRKADER